MTRTKNKDIVWKRIDSEKHEKFSTVKWRKGSKWKSELQRNLDCPGVYCLHDGTRIFYIGISDTGVMKHRWDPLRASSHDYGKKRKQGEGGKWSTQGKFASGNLKIKIKGNDGKVIKVSPQLDFYSERKIKALKKTRGRRRMVKNINNDKANQIARIRFFENMLIRKGAFFHRFGGSRSVDVLDVKKFQSSIGKLNFLEPKTELSIGWTMMNKKDGIPYENKIQENGTLKMNAITDKMNERAQKANIKIRVKGKTNPTSKLFKDFTGHTGIFKSDFGSSRKISKTVSLIQTNSKSKSKSKNTRRSTKPKPRQRKLKQNTTSIPYRRDLKKAKKGPNKTFTSNGKRYKVAEWALPHKGRPYRK
jgi:hypothetical protein